MFQENTFVTTKEAIKFIDEVLFKGEKVDGLKLYKINDRDFLFATEMQSMCLAISIFAKLRKRVRVI